MLSQTTSRNSPLLLLLLLLLMATGSPFTVILNSATVLAADLDSFQSCTLIRRYTQC
jgi:hypothetical protein